MNTKAKRVLRTIQDCVASGRYLVLTHFVRRMDSRGLFWPDIQAVVDSPETVEDSGLDKFGRAKWCLRGRTPGRLDPGIICVMDRDQTGNVTVFITVYWD